MAYPNTVDTWTTKVDGVDDVMASHVNLLQTQLSAVETELGTLPKGSYADVKTYLANLLHAFGDYVPTVRDQMGNTNQYLADGTNQLGFTTDTAVGDTYTPSGVWSKANTGAVNFYVLGHCLNVNSLGAGPSILQWTDSTAKNYLEIVGHPMVPRAGVPYGGEFRFWGVQTPGAGDNYWAVRFLYDAVTYTNWPYRIQLFSGTGITFTIADGTMRSDFPWDIARPVKMLMSVTAGPAASAAMRTLDAATDANILYGSVALMPASFKTMWAYVPTSYLAMVLDHIRVL